MGLEYWGIPYSKLVVDQVLLRQLLLATAQ